ncbi:hypothetical protein RND71_025714 [Anisodus tanguticus]|uniref:Uncharacterized protein n=1 Tax=Anisodus tanguticus TaxID=243964 RepID=A0AAE1RRU5_9SOLA|nr:hypothetical protein RND71_025714 [Anisodus tanguticus]
METAVAIGKGKASTPTSSSSNPSQQAPISTTNALVQPPSNNWIPVTRKNKKNKNQNPKPPSKPTGTVIPATGTVFTEPRAIETTAQKNKNQNPKPPSKITGTVIPEPRAIGNTVQAVGNTVQATENTILQKNTFFEISGAGNPTGILGGAGNTTGTLGGAGDPTGTLPAPSPVQAAHPPETLAAVYQAQQHTISGHPNSSPIASQSDPSLITLNQECDDIPSSSNDEGSDTQEQEEEEYIDSDPSTISDEDDDTEMEDDMAESSRGLEQLYMPRKLKQIHREEIEQYAEEANKEPSNPTKNSGIDIGTVIPAVLAIGNIDTESPQPIATQNHADKVTGNPTQSIGNQRNTADSPMETLAASPENPTQTRNPTRPGNPTHLLTHPTPPNSSIGNHSGLPILLPTNPNPNQPQPTLRPKPLSLAVSASQDNQCKKEEDV